MRLSTYAVKRQIRQETRDALGEGFVEDVGRYVVPIFTDVDRAPVSVGTGLLLDTELDHVLVTAAHVVDGFREGRTYYTYIAPATTRAIAGTVLLSKLPPSGSRDEDAVDIAVVILEGGRNELPPFAEVGKDSLPIRRVAVQSVPRDGRRYAFLGFPSSKLAVNRIVKGVVSTSHAYLASSVAAETYAQLGLDPTFYVVLPFHKRNIVTMEADKFNFPSLKGMSGSPLWELGNLDDGGRRVTGIMIRDKSKHHHVIIAADMWFALRMLADHYRATGVLT